MDSRKPHSSDHFFSVHTFNRWMASGFGLGVMASIMVISGIVYVSTPIPSTISTSFSSVFESVPGGVSHSKPEKSAGFLPGNEGGVIAEKAHDRNPPASSLTGREPVLEKTHEGNLVGDDKDSSSLLNREKTHDGNSSGISSTGLESDAVKRNSTVDFKDSSDLVSSGILKETHDGNLSKSSLNERMQGNWTGESSDSSSTVTVKDSSHKTLDGDLPKSSFSGKDRYVGNSTGDTETSSVKTPVEDASGGIPKMTVPSEKINEANSSWSNVTNPNGGNTSKDYNVGEGFGKKDGIDEKEHGRNGEGRNVSHGSDEGWSSERMHEGASKINGSDSTKMREDFSETCNIFNGRWVRDERQPFYAPGSCPYIDDDFNCHKNGRTDDGFLRWRWQPNDCNIPRLNATDFLERLRSKRLIFVGDSLNRNMWESLVCILRDSVSDKSRVYEVAGRSEFKTSGYYAFRFEDYNCSVDFVRSSFLVKEIFSKNANGSEDEKLRLDLLDETTSAYREAEIIVFNTGHWWTHDKTSRGIDYYQEGNYVYPVLKANEAYKKALSTWARWVDKNINSNKSQVVFRGYSLTHFRGGQWNSGGQCHTETEPIFNESFLAKYPLKMRTLERVVDQMRTPVIYLNISRLTDYRKDGHPSIYRKTYKTVAEQIAAEKSQDCSHWCLPGIPDTWNELLYASLLMGGQGSWRRSNINSDTSSSR